MLPECYSSLFIQEFITCVLLRAIKMHQPVLMPKSQSQTVDVSKPLHVLNIQEQDTLLLEWCKVLYLGIIRSY